MATRCNARRRACRTLRRPWRILRRHKTGFKQTFTSHVEDVVPALKTLPQGTTCRCCHWYSRPAPCVRTIVCDRILIQGCNRSLFCATGTEMSRLRDTRKLFNQCHNTSVVGSWRQSNWHRRSPVRNSKRIVSNSHLRISCWY